MLLLDTDVLIDIQRGHAAATAWFAALPDVPWVPGFVVMELIQSAQNLAQVSTVMKLVAPLPIAWPSEADCTFGLNHFAAFNLTHGIGLLDALIAATAVGRGATLCTFNVKHYRSVPSLVTQQPYKR